MYDLHFLHNGGNTTVIPLGTADNQEIPCLVLTSKRYCERHFFFLTVTSDLYLGHGVLGGFPTGNRISIHSTFDGIRVAINTLNKNTLPQYVMQQ